MNFSVSIRTVSAILLVVVLTFWVSCGNWGWEPVTGDTDPKLNVFGLISTDPAIESFVVVHQTISLEGPDVVEVQDTLWWGPDSSSYTIQARNQSRYVVENATVRVSRGGASWLFTPVAPSKTTYPWEIRDLNLVYKDTTGSFSAQPGQSYTLSVTTPEGLTLTGSTITPAVPQFAHLEALPDTIQLHRNFTVRWRPDPEHNYQLTTTGDLYLCGSEYDELLQPRDSVWTSQYPYECFENEWDPEAVKLDIILKALDENFYGYFFQHQADEFFSFFMGQGGEIAQYGVTGGYGVFGSISRSRIQRIAVP